MRPPTSPARVTLAHDVAVTLTGDWMLEPIRYWGGPECGKLVPPHERVAFRIYLREGRYEWSPSRRAFEWRQAPAAHPPTPGAR